MIYGDLQIFDILIFAGIAAFLFFRLSKVLGQRGGFEKSKNQPMESDDEKINEEKTIPELDPKLSKLSIAYENIKDFNHNDFFEGAKSAFETILNAYNNEDKTTLKNLVTKDVYAAFEKSINEKNIQKDMQILSIKIEKVEEVVIKNSNIYISIKFLSEQIFDNDEKKKTTKEDTWIFEKPINSNNPNWFLSST